MTPEQTDIPDWARHERESDFGWIGENLHVFWPVATKAFSEEGRGAIVVDTTSRPTGEGHPFGYFPQDAIETGDDEDIKRLVREYDPEHELVVVMLKPNDKTSTYRVQTKPQEHND